VKTSTSEACASDPEVATAAYMSPVVGSMAIAGPLRGLTPGMAGGQCTVLRRTWEAKVEPWSVEVATMTFTLPSGGSAKYMTATRPPGPAATTVSRSSLPLVGSMARDGSKLCPPSVERVKRRLLVDPSKTMPAR